MGQLEKILNKWNFKKIAVCYIIITVIVAVACTATVGIVFKDRLSFAWQYSCTNQTVKESNSALIEAQIQKLASASSDVVDVLLLDSNNNVLYSANNSQFADGQLILEKVDSNNYLASTKYKDIVFKYVKKDEFMLTSILNKDFSQIKDDYNDDSFYKNGFSDKTVYMLSYIGNANNDYKIYVINSPTDVAGGMFTLKIVACIVMFFFMIYWVLVALWAYKDAAKRKVSPLLWGTVVLLTNFVGVIVYELYKHNSLICEKCGALQPQGNAFCTQCGKLLGEKCNVCGGNISQGDKFCSHCGNEVK